MMAARGVQGEQALEARHVAEVAERGVLDEQVAASQSPFEGTRQL